MKRKIAIIFLTALILSAVIAIIVCDKIITNNSRGKLSLLSQIRKNNEFFTKRLSVGCFERM